MALGRLQSEWSRTSQIAYLIAESNRNPKTRRRPFSPTDFNPFDTKKTSEPAIESDIRVLMVLAQE